MMKQLLKRFSHIFGSISVSLCLVGGSVAFANVSASASNPIDGSSCGSWVRVVDVSSYQPNVNWAAAKSDGVSGAWIKTTVCDVN